jgi:hypothetical protein
MDRDCPGLPAPTRGTLPAMQGGNPEGLHQMRVALRHLRTAISLFADLWSTHIVSCHSFVTTYPDDARQDFVLPSQRSCRGACRLDHDRPACDVKDMLNAWSGRSGAGALIIYRVQR